MKSQKITKSKEKYKDTFTAHEVGVILENLNDKFDLLTEKIASHDERFEKIEKKLEIIALNQTKTLDRVTALEAGQKLLIKRVDSLEKKIDTLDQRLNQVELGIKEIKDSIKNLVDLDKFYVLEKRVTKLENHVASFSK